MLLIRNPNSPNSRQTVTLGDNLVNLYFKFNIRNQSWYITIKDSSNENTILSGVKVMPNQNLTGRYILEELSGGNLWCIRNSNNFSDVGRSNLGEDKTYSVYWISSDEEIEVNIDDLIQL